MFQPKIVERGEPILAEDWNDLGQNVVTHIEGDGKTIRALRMGNTVVLEVDPQEQQEESVGQYIGMVHSVVAQETDGWEFPVYTTQLD